MTVMIPLLYGCIQLFLFISSLNSVYLRMCVCVVFYPSQNSVNFLHMDCGVYHEFLKILTIIFSQISSSLLSLFTFLDLSCTYARLFHIILQLLDALLIFFILF